VKVPLAGAMQKRTEGSMKQTLSWYSAPLITKRVLVWNFFSYLFYFFSFIYQNVLFVDIKVGKLLPEVLPFCKSSVVVCFQARNIYFYLISKEIMINVQTKSYIYK
jgi:hypothetical protein